MLKKLRKLLGKWGSGIITGGADNDPAGITTYAVSGAQFGYSQLWLMVMATPMLVAVQAMCSRLGLVKRKGLAAIIKDHYSPGIALGAIAILIISNVLTLGADLVGVAAAAGLMTGTPYIWWVLPVGGIIWYLVVFQNYPTIRRFLLWLNLLFVAYIFAVILVSPDWLVVLRGLVVPTIYFDMKYLLALMGVLGTTITPFLLFWQTQSEVEDHSGKAVNVREIKTQDILLAPGFIFSNLISICIMIATASVVRGQGLTDLTSAAQAAQALEPVAGPLAKYLFGLGIIGAGFVAIPILAASAGAAIAEIFGWKESLSDRPNKARGFYLVISVAIFLGIFMGLVGFDPIKALLYSQVLAGCVGPLLIVLLIFLCNDVSVMGRYVNGWFDNLFGWFTVAVMTLGTVGLLWQLF